MTPEVVPERPPDPGETRTATHATKVPEFVPANRFGWVADLFLIGMFLSLAFLLGAFPLKDVDYYWHLRTGDLIRQTGRVPTTDIFTYTAAPNTPWIDLHWIYQVAISWGFEHAGVVGLNLAKCALTCLALALLVTARRGDWPIWVMLLAWMPALMVLSGRMYIRPETLTLVYLSMFLAVIFRWDRIPRLAYALPLIQVAWVNSHGLFVLGPIILTFGLFDGLLRHGALTAERRSWWRTIGLASGGTILACLINPYFLTGALYPLALAGTMRNPVFSRSIAELMPIPMFIETTGWRNLPLQLQFLTMILGALSFMVPLAWRVFTRASRSPAQLEEPLAQTVVEPVRRKRKSRSKPGGKKTPKSVAPTRVPEESGWRLSPFRLLLYCAFSFLSLQATRNSHQFAAVVGTVTAWNFGEWAAAVMRDRERRGCAVSRSWARSPRLLTITALALALAWVGSGAFYRMTGEGRVIGLGEEPLWFPHEAVRFAGRPGMPERFLSFHNGHASLYDYYNGPDRKVYTDPRLEVAGADLFLRYRALEQRLLKNEPGWENELDSAGRPAILVDHEFSSAIGVTLMASAHWRCVWFDPVAAVFIHDSFLAPSGARAIDFAAGHFLPDSKANSADIPTLTAAGKAYRNYVQGLSQSRVDLARPLGWLALDRSRRILEQVPDSFDAWKIQGQVELSRITPRPPAQSFRAAFDPVSELSLVRATYALRRALQSNPYDFVTIFELKRAYDLRGMHEAAASLLDRLLALYPKNPHQANLQELSRPQSPEYAKNMGNSAPTIWRNLSELDRNVSELLARGRVESAAALLQRAYPAERSSWETADQKALLWLHLGEPARARAMWEAASPPAKSPGQRDARIGTTYLVEGNTTAARASLEKALQAPADRFDSLYLLAVLEQDDGNPKPALEHAREALAIASDEAGRGAARAIAAAVERFAR
jgi:tetratricopeptide (TPR) repeat protein